VPGMRARAQQEVSELVSYDEPQELGFGNLLHLRPVPHPIGEYIGIVPERGVVEDLRNAKVPIDVGIRHAPGL